jgi:integrase
LVPLSPRLLGELREYWKVVRPTRWLFPGGTLDRPISDTTVQKSCKRAAREAGLTKRVSPHVLRHSYATGLMEAGVDLLTISRLLGHRSFATTMLYLHVRRPHLERTVSPLDLLAVQQCPRFAEPEPAPSPGAAVGFQPLVPESAERTDSPQPPAAATAAHAN